MARSAATKNRPKYLSLPALLFEIRHFSAARSASVLNSCHACPATSRSIFPKLDLGTSSAQWVIATSPRLSAGTYD